MNFAFIWATFLIILCGVDAFNCGCGKLCVQNNLQLRSGASQLVKIAYVTRANTAVQSAPRTNSIATSMFNVLAYDTAYAVTKEAWQHKVLDNKIGKILFAGDYDEKKGNINMFLMIAVTVGLQLLWYGDRILKFLRLKKYTSPAESFHTMNQFWNNFTGAMPSEEKKNKQLLACRTQEDAVYSSPPSTPTFECEKCRMQLMPAKGRAHVIMNKPTFRCARCGSKASAYFDINNMADARAVARERRIQNEELGLDENGDELSFGVK